MGTRSRALLRGLLLLAIGLAPAVPAAAQVWTDPGLIIQTIDTSLWSPPSPDPHGLAYRPDTGELMTCDAEVEEIVGGITHYQGVNVWTHTRTGVVTQTATTMPWAVEPTGIAYDPAGGRVWISQDDGRRPVFQILFGNDGQFGTPDDVITQVRDLDDHGCDDPEDVTYNVLNGDLYIASGSGSEICRLEPGPNGIFDGLPPVSDDVITMYDTDQYGISDPEGVVYDPFWNTLVVADRGTRDLYELTPEGGLLRKIDVNFPSGSRPSGVTIAPGTTNPLLRNYYVTDRRVDNDADPNIIDGRIYEVVAVPLGGNGAPIVDAGLSQTIDWPANSVNLNGFVSDDGHPYPPSTVTALWSKQSGPGSVSFANPSQAVTSASFSAPGIYVLQLVGNDSALSSLDTITVIVRTTVTLSVTPTGPGSVTLSPPGGSYLIGDTVTVTALPNAGAGFVGFGGALSGSASPQNLLIEGNMSVTATFATLVNLSVATSGPGSVALSPPGGSYLPGTVVTLTATPGPNARFDAWSGDLTGGGAIAQITMNGDKAVTASFVQQYALSVSTNGPGSVGLAPAGGLYDPGTVVTLTATPGTNARFDAWSGAATGSSPTALVTMDADKAVTATFIQQYALSVTANGPGSVGVDPASALYDPGTVVTLTATPGPNARFDGWSGAATGSSPTALVTMDADKAVTATFIQQYTLSVTTNGPGSVGVDPAGPLYDAGSVVTLTATPGPNARLGGWSGALTGSNPTELLTMDGDKAVTAAFVQQYALSVTAIGPGSVGVDPTSALYDPGAVVTLTATPGPNARFDGWSGAATGSSPTALVTMDADKSVTATFIQQYTLGVTANGPGSVGVDPADPLYDAGSVVTLTATPGPSARFDGWSGDLTSGNAVELVTMDADKSITATFIQQYTLSVTANGPGSVGLDPAGGLYDAGSVVTLTATPGTNARFDAWSGDLTSSNAVELVTMDADKSVTASFVQQYTLTVTTTSGGSVNPPGGTYEPGTALTLTALPASTSWTFTGWSGDASGTSNPIFLVMDANKSVHASFAPTSTPPACGIGPELIALLPPLGWLYRRRKQRSSR